MYVQSGSREHLDQNTLAGAHQNPQETRIPSWNGVHWETLPLSGTFGAPPTLTIFRPQPPVSDGRSRTAIVQPRFLAPSAEPPAILPHAAPAAADVPTSHLPAIMDANVRPAMDGPSAAVPAIQDKEVAPAIDGSAHNVDGNTTKPPTAAEIRDKLLAARGLVATSRQAKGLSFCYYPYQRRGYNRPQSCMRTLCLTVILLISP